MYSYKLLCLLTASSLLLPLPLSAGEPLHHTPVVISGGQPAASHAAHWSYEGDGAPDKWGDLDTGFQLCKSGTAQSPVDLHKTINAYLPELYIQYRPGAATVVNNGHTIQVNVPAGSHMTIDGQTFNLLQYHFHTPSEYTIEGKRYAMELHFVHKNALGQLGVVAVMIEEGAANPAASAIWSHLPNMAGGSQPLEPLNPADLIPAEKDYFRLMGSLTTPPCSEGVHWHVLTRPISFSAAQIAAFKSLFPMNARPLQPLHSRLVVLDR